MEEKVGRCYCECSIRCTREGANKGNVVEIIGRRIKRVRKEGRRGTTESRERIKIV